MAGERHPSSLFFYFVAGALGVAFSGVLLVLAWNNALDNETRNFSFDAIAVENAVAANVRTADAVIDSLAAFIAAGDAEDSARFDDYTGPALKRHDFIDGMAYVVLEPGGARVVHGAGDYRADALEALLASEAALRIVREVVVSDAGAVPMVQELSGQADQALFLVQATDANAESPGLAVAALDLASLVEVLSVDPAMHIALYTESEGVAGRRLVYARTPLGGHRGMVIEPLREDASVRLERFSVRLITGKDLLWEELDKALVFVALFLGVGVTLLLVALARAKELQARELRARNLVIEEQVRQQTHELAEARDQALEASRVKSDFLASMSHEIRTPLNAIIGMAELLSETRLSGEQAKYVGVFRNAGEALLSLVNDILDLSKIEASQLELEVIAFDLHEIVEQAVEIYALKADAKRVELVADIAADVPLRARGDPGRLRQIILNLVGNAIKFTESGQIVVHVARQTGSRRAEALPLHVEVRDTGIGIPASKLDSIFASFTQVDSSTTRKYGGTGLGLTISKRLVEMMGGRIWVESVEGEGSCFQFDVCLGAAEDALPAPVVAAPLAGPVLVAEDNEGVRTLLERLLGEAGVDCVSVTDSNSAREALRARQAGTERFGAAVIDGDLPGADGLSVIEDARASGDLTPALVMLRPSTMTAGAARLETLPASAYLVKPVKRAQLAETLARVCSGAAPAAVRASGEAASASATRERARILLVEDNPDNRLLIKAYLKKEPYDITEAENGEVAFDAFRAESFDLVLMDVQMPVMDGYAATRAIRAWEREQQRPATPVIALTANAISEDMDKSRAAGCDDHLTKPIKKQTLLAALQARLSTAA